MAASDIYQQFIWLAAAGVPRGIPNLEFGPRNSARGIEF
jgi:hypothetical protein